MHTDKSTRSQEDYYEKLTALKAKRTVKITVLFYVLISANLDLNFNTFFSISSNDNIANAIVPSIDKEYTTHELLDTDSITK